MRSHGGAAHPGSHADDEGESGNAWVLGGISDLCCCESPTSAQPPLLEAFFSSPFVGEINVIARMLF